MRELGGYGWKEQRYGCPMSAPARAASDGDESLHLRNQLLYDPHPQACTSAVFRGVEGFAEAPQRLRCHSRTGVRESDSKARCPAIRPIDRIPHADRYRPWMVARFRSVI